ncbi:hypothetical protein [Streptomyces sp. P9-A4]|uniref:hypothetical protein n=1 Tax=Streptomyces sp. P9-A4 TaxID=3072285 RepID=UPI002FCBE4AB
MSVTPLPSVPATRTPGPAPGRSARSARPAPRFGALRHAAPALLGYLAVRLLGLAVLTRWAHLKGHGLLPLLAGSWDSLWYLDIAGHGYTAEPSYPRNLAFFPLFPGLVRALSAVLPGSRAALALGLAVVCSLAAAWGIFAVGDRLRGRRTGTVLVVLWGASPVAAVQWTAYTESLFTALAAWALFAVLDGRWAWAAGLAVAAGLTRPTGLAVAAAVSAAGLLAARRGEGRALAAALVAPLGWLGYVGWVGLVRGRWDGYFEVQRLWGNQWDGGAMTLRALRKYLVYTQYEPFFLSVVSVVLLLSAGLFLCCLADRQPLPLLVFTGVLLLVVLGSGGVWFPRARFLLPGFPLLLPLASGIVRARRPAAALVLTGAALSSAWLGGHMLLVWDGAP